MADPGEPQEQLTPPWSVLPSGWLTIQIAGGPMRVTGLPMAAIGVAGGRGRAEQPGDGPVANHVSVLSPGRRTPGGVLEGESRLRMPPLVKEVGKVELFIHDSLHTFKNTLFEMEQAASVMPPGGVMLIDDIRSHDGFLTFAKRHPEFTTILVSTLDGIGAIGIAVSA